MAINRVVLAANDHPDYQFLAPLTAILWAERTHYRPLVVTTKTTDALRFLHDADIIDGVATGGDFPNDRLAIKLARWYCHGIPSKDGRAGVSPDDNLLLQDVDIWPVSTEFWNREHKKPATCHFGDAFQAKRHCTSGFRAPASVLAVIAPGIWEERLEQLRGLPDSDERRHSDDAAQSELVLAWMKEHPDDYELIERGPSPPKDRIDRSNWPTFTDYMISSGSWRLGDRAEQDYVDAHLPRDCSDRRVWNLVRPLFHILAPSWEGWADAYYEAWSRS